MLLSMTYPMNFHLLTRISGVEDGDEDTVMPREVGTAGSSRAPLAIISLTLFPHCLRTCATCSLLIPARSVSPIFRMWSPLHNRPCWIKREWFIRLYFYYLIREVLNEGKGIKNQWYEISIIGHYACGCDFNCFFF